MTGKIGSAAAAVFAAAAGVLLSPAMAQAQDPVCPEGTYWDAAIHQCAPVTVYVDPAPVVGPVGPVGVGGVVGPVGPGPVGPGPVGPGPLGPGR